MAKQNSNIIQLIEALNKLNEVVCVSESTNRQVRDKAIDAVRKSDLDDQVRTDVVRAISSAANPSGWYYESNGIKAGINVLNALEIEAPTESFNHRNLANLVSDGSIFSVEFVRRTDGNLRKMVCRLGVKKHLKGSSKSYDPKKHNLLTVFDMENKGYRSIPVDAVSRCRSYSLFKCYGGAKLGRFQRGNQVFCDRSW